MNHLNANLERMVDKKTKELSERNRELEESTTELEKSNLQLIHLSEALTYKNESINEFFKEKAQLGKVILHDLKQPLSALDVFFKTQLRIAQNQNDELKIKRLNMSSYDLKRVFILINNMAEVQELTTPSGNTSFEFIEFFPLLDKYIGQLKIIRPDLKLDLQFSEYEKIKTWANKAELEWVFENIMMTFYHIAPRDSTLSVFAQSDNDINHFNLNFILEGMLFEKKDESVILKKEYAVNYNEHTRVHFGLSLAYCQRILDKMDSSIKCLIDEDNLTTNIFLSFPFKKMEKVVEA